MAVFKHLNLANGLNSELYWLTPCETTKWIATLLLLVKIIHSAKASLASLTSVLFRYTAAEIGPIQTKFKVEELPVS